MGLAQPALPKTETCTFFGKAILTKSGAKSTANRDSKRTGQNDGAYQCRRCGGWHVGTRRKFKSGDWRMT